MSKVILHQKLNKLTKKKFSYLVYQLIFLKWHLMYYDEMKNKSSHVDEFVFADW